MTITPTNIESVALSNGDIYLLDTPQFRNAMDGKVLVGVGVDTHGQRLDEQHVLVATDIVERVAMDYDDDLNLLIPNPTVTPFADRVH